MELFSIILATGVFQYYQYCALLTKQKVEANIWSRASFLNRTQKGSWVYLGMLLGGGGDFYFCFVFCKPGGNKDQISKIMKEIKNECGWFPKHIIFLQGIQSYLSIQHFIFQTLQRGRTKWVIVLSPDGNSNPTNTSSQENNCREKVSSSYENYLIGHCEKQNLHQEQP